MPRMYQQAEKAGRAAVQARNVDHVPQSDCAASTYGIEEMTCIAGLVHGGKVYIGGDSAGVGGWSLSVRADEKVFMNGDFLFGFTSSFRMGQVLRHAFTPPKRHPDKDVMSFMVTDFVNAVRNTFKEAGVASKSNEVESCGTFLVGYMGRLFSIQDDYQVGEAACGYDAVGCGQDIALGSLYATADMVDQKARIGRALHAAEAHSAGVRGPFLIKSI